MFWSLLSLEQRNRKVVGSRQRPTILRSLLWTDQPHIVPGEKTLVWFLQHTRSHDLDINSHYGTLMHKHTHTRFISCSVRSTAVQHLNWSIKLGL